MEFTEAQAAVDEGMPERARDRETSAIKRLVAAWKGGNINKSNAALDALAIVYAPNLFKWV
jgi:hypothetical protein